MTSQGHLLELTILAGKGAGRRVMVQAPGEAILGRSSGTDLQLIDDRAVEKVNRFVSDALERGAKRLTGGHREGEGHGRLFDPMVMVNVPEEALLACDEVFGPVVAVWPFETVEDAFERVNKSPYGLQAGIYTNDLTEATRAFEALEVGAVLVGEIPTWRVDQMPYGGVKASGFGREGLKECLTEYTEPRLCVLPRP